MPEEISWQIPKQLWIEYCKTAARTYWPMAIRLGLVGAACSFAAYYYVNHFFPSVEFPWKVFVAWVAVHVVAVASIPICMWCSRPSKYKLVEKGIQGAGDQGAILRWSSIKAFDVEPDPALPDERRLVLYYRSRKRSLSLPDPALAGRIIEYVADRVPSFDGHPEFRDAWLAIQPVSKAFIWLMAAASIATAVVMAQVDFRGLFSGDVIQLFLYGFIMFGPASLLAFCRYRMSMFHQRNGAFVWALCLNTLAVGIGILIILPGLWPG